MRKRDGFTVYVVDGDAAVRDSLRALLEAEGFTIETFPSGELFLDHFHPGGKACLLLDLRVPVKEGIELLEMLAHREHHLPIIVMTGHPSAAIRKRALDGGAIAFIEKPFEPDDLVRTIDKFRS